MRRSRQHWGWLAAPSSCCRFGSVAQAHGVALPSVMTRSRSMLPACRLCHAAVRDQRGWQVAAVLYSGRVGRVVDRMSACCNWAAAAACAPSQISAVSAPLLEHEDLSQRLMSDLAAGMQLVKPYEHPAHLPACSPPRPLPRGTCLQGRLTPSGTLAPAGSRNSFCSILILLLCCLMGARAPHGTAERGPSPG